MTTKLYAASAVLWSLLWLIELRGWAKSVQRNDRRTHISHHMILCALYATLLWNAVANLLNAGKWVTRSTVIIAAGIAIAGHVSAHRKQRLGHGDDIES